MSLKLSEIFYSLQGEGPMTGYPAVFIRTAGCNLNCGQEPGAEWKCDTWNIMRSAKMELDPQFLTDFLESKVPDIVDNPAIRIVFTGGEPFLQADDFYQAVLNIKKKFLDGAARIDVETNGTIFDQDILSLIKGYVVISPKLKNSHIPDEKRYNVNTLKNILNTAYDAYFKLVVSSEYDVNEIREYIPLLEEVYRDEWYRHIYLMPAMEDVPAMEIKQLVWQTCMKLGIPMSMRAQIDTFGRRTGV